MMAINMPLKRLAGISIDGDSGLIGWIHGVLVLVYMLSLAVTARAQGWGVGRVIVAFVASLVPGGAFVFERWLAKREAE
jgi:integral membrane protein